MSQRRLQKITNKWQAKGYGPLMKINTFSIIFVSFLFALNVWADTSMSHNTTLNTFNNDVFSVWKKTAANHTVTLNYGIFAYPILAYSGKKTLSDYSLLSYSFSDFLTQSAIQYKRLITKNMDFKIDIKNFDNVTLGWEIRR